MSVSPSPVHVLNLPARPHIHAIVGGREQSRAGHRVLRVDRIGDLLRRQPEFGELRVGDLDIDALLLVGNEVDLVDIGHPQQLGAQPLGIVMQLRERKPVAFQRVDVGVDVAELVVEEGPLNTRGQRVGDITDLLANLVPGVRHLRGRRRILDGEEQRRLARPRIAPQIVDVGRLLQLAGDAVGHFLLHLARGRARPERADHHHLERERRILGLRQLAVGQHAEQRDQHQQKDHQRLMAQGPAREVESVARRLGWGGWRILR